nr:MAG TPA: hypothetical protein [Caudoviricetes sp.]
MQMVMKELFADQSYLVHFTLLKISIFLLSLRNMLFKTLIVMLRMFILWIPLKNTMPQDHLL